ncbi:reverse transcriptase domain-containing protein [Flavobacterium sp.]|uniref:reverse transcriptase domain-containing protein n=1 Tax=Flavobacterium sp. TaxID=239 RepID=UPI00248A2285|nr:reverse transcriptase domain-containing protein [Flavobacterium sp.]MDI1315796.1 reverse transcriptase domain-containing protein [Flavobacterium sp.]
MKRKDWFKDRGYPHFSNKTPIDVRQQVENYIANPNNIEKHSFYPLIFKEISQRRYKRSDFKGIERHSHKTMKDGKVISNRKIREILYASHVDSHIYSYYSQNIISKEYEKYLENSIVSVSISAYRQIPAACKTKFKNNTHFAKDVFDEIVKRQDCVALAFDIENFFPSLNHKLLKLSWAKILGRKSLPKDHYNLFKAITKFSYVKLNDLKFKKGHFNEKALAKLRMEGKSTFFNSLSDLIDSDIIIHKNQKHKDGKLIGIPQGLPISALLANIYMLPFDEAIIERLTVKNDIFYRRYSDDIVIVCEEKQIEFVEKFIKEQIEKIKLIISIPKTEITVFKIDDNRLQSFRLKDGMLKKNIPLNYLGFEFYGYQTLLKSKNLATFYREMKDSIRRKHKRAEKIKEKYLLDSAPIFKRKIYRLYSYKGEKKRYLPAKNSSFVQGKLVISEFERKYRGNYLRYVYRSSEEMEAPEIKMQVRNHWKILKSALGKYNFNNV